MRNMNGAGDVAFARGLCAWRELALSRRGKKETGNRKEKLDGKEVLGYYFGKPVCLRKFGGRGTCALERVPKEFG